MSLYLCVILPAIFATGPVETAIRATEAPNALRAAFTVEIRSDTAERLFSYDPRRAEAMRWQTLSARGEDARLDAVAAQWAAETAPDNRLFADNIRSSLTGATNIEDLGAAWRVGFTQTSKEASPVSGFKDTVILDGEAWVEPSQGRLMRLSYRLKAPILQADGGQLTDYSQTYLLESERAWGLSYISAYKVSMAVESDGQTLNQAYQANIRQATFFFANPASEDAYRKEVRALVSAY